MFTPNVIRNSTSPAAINADSWNDVASPNRDAINTDVVDPPNCRIRTFTWNANDKIINAVIVSPNARPRPSIVPPMIPPRPNGINTIQIIPQCVDPNANAASFSPGGHNENTSRITEHAIGITINDTTSPAMNNDDVYDPCAQSGARGSVSTRNTGTHDACNANQCEKNNARGIKKKNPHNPTTTLGIAAIKSTKLTNTRCTVGGAYSVIYNANPNANGNATTIATAANSNVPTRTASIPI